MNNFFKMFVNGFIIACNLLVRSLVVIASLIILNDYFVGFLFYLVVFMCVIWVLYPLLAIRFRKRGD